MKCVSIFLRDVTHGLMISMKSNMVAVSCMAAMLFIRSDVKESGFLQ